MMKSVKTLRMTRLRRRVLLWARSKGGASNEYIFSKVSQIAFSQGFANAKCMYFRKLFANMLWQKYLGLASFRKYDFAGFHKLCANSQICFRSVSQYYSQAFTIYGFASFSKHSQGFANGLSQGFTSANIMVFRKDQQWGRMGTLLMLYLVLSLFRVSNYPSQRTCLVLCSFGPGAYTLSFFEIREGI